MFYDKLKTIAILTIALMWTFVVFPGPISYAVADIQLTEDELYNIYFNDKFNQEFNNAFNSKFNEEFNFGFNEEFNTKFNNEWLMNNPREMLAN